MSQNGGETGSNLEITTLLTAGTGLQRPYNILCYTMLSIEFDKDMPLVLNSVLPRFSKGQGAT